MLGDPDFSSLGARLRGTLGLGASKRNVVAAMAVTTTAPSASRGEVEILQTTKPKIFGLPSTLVLGAGALGAGLLAWKFLFSGGATPLPVKTNPRRYRNPGRTPVATQSERLRNAIKTYEGFHWGDSPDKFVQKKVSKPPKVGVKLGKLVSVAYETHKNGEKAVWEHEFGEEGGKRPDLVMDADTKKLHIVGGSYDVRDEGIID